MQEILKIKEKKNKKKEKKEKKKKLEQIAIAVEKVNKSIDSVKNECNGIKKDLDTIFALSVATTVSSGVGTLAAGTALTTGILKDKAEGDIFKPETENITVENVEQVKENLDKKIKQLDANKLGNVRTVAMGTAAATSAVSTGTSIGAAVNAKKLAEKMEKCNAKLAELKLAKAELEAEEPEDKTQIDKASSILGVCTGYNQDNIITLKTKMTANAIVSGVGTGAATAGTVTSVLANSDKTSSDKKQKLDLTTNILAGVTTGTSATSTVLSATSIDNAKKDSEMAKNCEEILK